MIPKVDKNNPGLVAHVLRAIQPQMTAAMEANQKVESAVLPLYAILPTKAHLAPKRKPEQFGSGVVVKIRSEYFIFSCQHVFSVYGQYPLITGTLSGKPVEIPHGDSFNSNRYDASVYHIKGAISNDFRNLAITLTDFDLSPSLSARPVFMAAGFRAKKSNTSGNKIDSKREAYPSIEVGESIYKIFDLDSSIHLALAYESQIYDNGHWRASPKPKGFSGGAMIKALGTNVKPPIEQPKNVQQLLTAIITDYHMEKGDKPGILYGTRIHVHLALVKQFLPGLL
jgi:hypothetical protein